MGIQGIIRPPLQIRAVVDKTASFVAKNGRAFENKIINSAKGREPKFAFLHPTSHYHAYYEDRIVFYQNGGTNDEKKEEEKKPAASSDDKTSEKEVTSKGENETKETSTKTPTSASRKTKSIVEPVARALLTQRSHIQKIVETQESEKEESKAKEEATKSDEPATLPNRRQLIAPPGLHYTTLLPPKGISTAQLEILQFTAQVVALQGRGGSFLRDLSRREWDNPTQWGFLQPRHAHYSYFSNLVDVYKRILSKRVLEKEKEWKGSLLEIQELKTRVGLDMNENEGTNDVDEAGRQGISLTNELKQEQDNMKYMAKSVENCLEKVAYAAEYDLHMEEKRRKQKELTDDEGGILGGVARVDWHDFVVVETIDFPVDEVVERLPPPPASAVEEIVAEESKDDEEEAMEESSSDEDDGDDEKIKVVSDYAPKVVSSAARFTSDARTHVIDPITKKRIALQDTTDHMRIQLMDPEWAKQQKIFKEKQKESNYVEGDMIARNVSAFAKARGDLLGNTGDQQITHEKDANKSEQDSNAAIEEQQQQPQLPPPIPGPSQITPMTQVQPNQSAISSHPRPELSLPDPKRSRTEPSSNEATFATASLHEMPIPIPPKPQEATVNMDDTETSNAQLSEKDFCASLTDRNVVLSIMVPNDPSNAPWNFNGQTLSITVDVMTVIKSVKQQIQSQLGGMPVNKMQLKSPNTGFLKDGLTLAFLNIGSDHGPLELVPKVRGRGRK